MKKIKKFFIINVFLSFILVGSLYTLSWIWSNYADECSVKFLELEKKNIRNLKIINVGSSHTTYGIKYPKNIKGYNMGLSSQKFYYDFEILKKYHNRFDKDCVIIIPISIFSFYSGNDVEYISRNYIQFLNQKVILGVNKNEYILGKYFSATQPIVKIPKILKYIVVSLKNRKFDKKYVVYSENLSFEEKQKAAVETALSHLGISKENTKHSNDKSIGINQLTNMLNFCEKRGFRPILISTPQTYLYNEQIGEKNYQERIYDNIKEVEKQMNKKYLYLDYSHDKRFINNLEYFSDDDHLNEKGAEYFTEILLKDIKEKNYNF